jgi:U4/U6.U5 tri-snRNP-associated protein 2
MVKRSDAPQSSSSSSPATKRARTADDTTTTTSRQQTNGNGNDDVDDVDDGDDDVDDGDDDDADSDDERSPLSFTRPATTTTAAAAAGGSQACPYLDTIDRRKLDLDLEKLCSVTLAATNVYACLVCGRYYQGRGRDTQAHFHALESDHRVFMNLHTALIYCLPDGYQVSARSNLLL